MTLEQRDERTAAIRKMLDAEEVPSYADLYDHLEFLLEERRTFKQAHERLLRQLNGIDERETAEREAQRFAPSGTALCLTWQGYGDHVHHTGVHGIRPLPETFDYNEAVAAVVSQLNREGVRAWNGDATWCIAHMLNAQFRRWQFERETHLKLRQAVLDGASGLLALMTEFKG